MTEFKLIDSSVWIAYLIDGKFKELIESSETFLISSLSLFEIKRVLLKNKKIPLQEIQNIISFIKEKSLIINLDEKISEKSSEISIKNNLPAIDSLIYTTALINKAQLITLDNDFRNLSGVTIL
jgi:predicted nucleic acid-binding protein